MDNAAEQGITEMGDGGAVVEIGIGKSMVPTQGKVEHGQNLAEVMGDAECQRLCDHLLERKKNL